MNNEEKNTLPESYSPDAVEDKTEDVSDSHEYYALPTERASMLWSVLSLLAAVISIPLSLFYYVGIAFAIFAIVAAIISSRKLGFFDKKSIFGLVVGIFGVIFGAFICVLDLTGLGAEMFGL